VTSTEVDVTLTKTVAPAVVSVGAQATFTLRIANAGPAPATGTSLTDPLPPGLDLVAVTTTQGTCTSSAPVICAFGTLQSGASAMVTIVVRGTAPGSYLNRATVAENEVDAALSNNSAQARLDVRGAFKPPVVPTPEKSHRKHLSTVAHGKPPAFTG
jgi:uncharacterized repeat protein (TIGR01451 family)